MTDYEIIGRGTVLVCMVAVTLIALQALFWFAWHVAKEVIGWPRIIKALKLLRESEEGEKP